MHSVQIYPSLMAADVLNLASVIHTLEPHCDGFHIDIMDNHFVPNITWGAHLTNEIAEVAIKPLFVHLMVTDPESIINKLKLTHGSVITVHLEVDVPLAPLFELITTYGYTPSIAIKPSTPLSKLYPYLQAGISHVLLMSVEPGFAGQKFIDHSFERLRELATYKESSGNEFIICMDGGISEHTIGKLYHDGAQQFATSSAIFDQNDPVQALKELYVKTRS